LRHDLKAALRRNGQPYQSLETELTVDLIWGIYGLPPPEKEYRFHPTRQWRFDYCWPKRRVAVEIEGGLWNAGRHTRAGGFLADMEKYNAAGLLGWRLFRFSPAQLKNGEAQTFMKNVLTP